MIIFLYGPDDYRRERKRIEIVSEFRRKHPDGAVARFDFEEERDAAERFHAFARTVSLFEPEKLAVLYGAVATGSKEFAAQVKELADRRELTMLMTESGVPASGPFGFLRKGHPSILASEFKRLEGGAWLSFVKTESFARSVALSPDAVRSLAELFAGDPWGLVTELDKLACLPKRAIGARELEAAGLSPAAPDFRRAMGALGSASMAERLGALEMLFARNDAPAKTFNIAAAWFPARAGDFAGFDLAVKSGKMDYEEALLALATSA